MKVKYIGKFPQPFYIPGVPGEWKVGEIREIDDKFWEILGKRGDFSIVKEEKKKKEE